MRRLRTSRQPIRRSRSGFSLIEVILATALLLGSVVVLYRLIGMGRIHIQKARQTAQAQRICENLLSELIAGVRPLRAVESEPLRPAGPDHRPADPETTDFETTDETSSDEDGAGRLTASGQPQDRLLTPAGRSRWMHTVRFRSRSDIPGLLNVTVVVWSADDQAERPVRFSLSRWVRRRELTSSPGDVL